MKNKYIPLLMLSIFANQSFADESKQLINENKIYSVNETINSITLKMIGISTPFKDIDNNIKKINTFLNTKDFDSNYDINMFEAKSIQSLNGYFISKRKNGIYLNETLLKGSNGNTNFIVNESDDPKNRFIILINENNINLYYPTFKEYKNIDISVLNAFIEYTKNEKINKTEIEKILNKGMQISLNKDEKNKRFTLTISIKNIPKKIIKSEIFVMTINADQNINDDNSVVIDYNNKPFKFMDTNNVNETKNIKDLNEKITINKYTGKDIAFKNNINYLIKDNKLIKLEKCISGINKCSENRTEIAIYQNDLQNKNIVKAIIENGTAYILYETGQLDVFNVNNRVVEDRLFNIVDIEDNILIKAIAKGLKQSSLDVEQITQDQIENALRNELTTSFDLDIVNVPNFDEMFSFYVDSYPTYEEDYFNQEIKEYLKNK